MKNSVFHYYCILVNLQLNKVSMKIKKWGWIIRLSSYFFHPANFKISFDNYYIFIRKQIEKKDHYEDPLHHSLKYIKSENWGYSAWKKCCGVYSRNYSKINKCMR